MLDFFNHIFSFGFRLGTIFKSSKGKLKLTVRFGKGKEKTANNASALICLLPVSNDWEFSTKCGTESLRALICLDFSKNSKDYVR